MDVLKLSRVQNQNIDLCETVIETNGHFLIIGGSVESDKRIERCHSGSLQGGELECELLPSNMAGIKPITSKQFSNFSIQVLNLNQSALDFSSFEIVDRFLLLEA